jgi:hypothetical protein
MIIALLLVCSPLYSRSSALAYQSDGSMSDEADSVNLRKQRLKETDFLAKLEEVESSSGGDDDDESMPNDLTRQARERKV